MQHKTETGIDTMVVLNGEFRLILTPTSPIGEALIEQILGGEFEIASVSEPYQIPGQGKNITKGLVLRRKDKVVEE